MTKNTFWGCFLGDNFYFIHFCWSHFSWKQCENVFNEHFGLKSNAMCSIRDSQSELFFRVRTWLEDTRGTLCRTEPHLPSNVNPGLINHGLLVGGFNSSEKWRSIKIIIPNIWKKMFQTTNQFINWGGIPPVMIWDFFYGSFPIQQPFGVY